jgi:hypothetical protein
VPGKIRRVERPIADSPPEDYPWSARAAAFPIRNGGGRRDVAGGCDAEEKARLALHIGKDKAHNNRDSVTTLQAMNITPHISLHTKFGLVG